MPSILNVIADNQALFDAVKTEILKQFSLDKLPIQTNQDNDQIGEVVRARLEGKRLVEAAFIEISRYKTKSEGRTSENPAR